jgi:hypothetical protein
MAVQRRFESLPPHGSATLCALPYHGTDDELVERLLERNPQALAHLFDRFAESTLLVLAALLGPGPHLADALHDCFARALDEIGRGTGPRRLDVWMKEMAAASALGRFPSVRETGRPRLRSRDQIRQLPLEEQRGEQRKEFVCHEFVNDLLASAQDVDLERERQRFLLRSLRGPRRKRPLGLVACAVAAAVGLGVALFVVARDRAERAGAWATASAVAGEAPCQDCSWQQFEREGRHSEAVDAALLSGLGQILATATSSELLALARAAGYAGRGDMSEQLLRHCRARFAGSSDANLAAYLLGLSALELRDMPAEAADWFAIYLAENPRGPLAREALGRQMESELRAGHREAAQAVARRYLTLHPTGPELALAEDLAQGAARQVGPRLADPSEADPTEPELGPE